MLSPALLLRLCSSHCAIASANNSWAAGCSFSAGGASYLGLPSRSVRLWARLNKPGVRAAQLGHALRGERAGGCFEARRGRALRGAAAPHLRIDARAQPTFAGQSATSSPSTALAVVSVTLCKAAARVRHVRSRRARTAKLSWPFVARTSINCAGMRGQVSAAGAWTLGGYLDRTHLVGKRRWRWR